MSGHLAAQEPSNTVSGLSFDNPKFSKASGFTFFGDGDQLADVIDDKQLGIRALNVEVVRLEQHKVTAHELNSLSSLPKLRTLILGQSPDPIELEADAVAALERFTSLEALEVHAVVKPATSWKCIGALVSLKSLEISGTFVLEEGDLNAISELKSLVTLELDAVLHTSQFDWLSKLKRLETLRLQDETISSAVFGALAQMTELKCIMLFTRNASPKEEEERKADGATHQAER